MDMHEVRSGERAKDARSDRVACRSPVRDTSDVETVDAFAGGQAARRILEQTIERHDRHVVARGGLLARQVRDDVLESADRRRELAHDMDDMHPKSPRRLRLFYPRPLKRGLNQRVNDGGEAHDEDRIAGDRAGTRGARALPSPLHARADGAARPRPSPSLRTGRARVRDRRRRPERARPSRRDPPGVRRRPAHRPRALRARPVARAQRRSCGMPGRRHRLSRRRLLVSADPRRRRPCELCRRARGHGAHGPNP